MKIRIIYWFIVLVSIFVLWAISESILLKCTDNKETIRTVQEIESIGVEK